MYPLVNILDRVFINTTISLLSFWPIVRIGKRGKLILKITMNLSGYRWNSLLSLILPLQTWSLLTDESGNGTVQAWQALVGVGGRLTDGVAKTLRDDFAACLCDSLTAMLRDELGLTPTIPTSEIGRLLEAVIHGMGFQLASGTEEEELEGAYSAAWLSILSLTQPST